MNRMVTTGIVLSRINYKEADRIITVITPEFGKLKLMARGVRKIKSKLAGGIELFSVSSLTFVRGRGEIDTLVSAQLQSHYGNIVSEYSRTMVGYDCIKIINKTTHDDCDEDYYQLLLHLLISLNDLSINFVLTKCWFMVCLLNLLGHTPNMQTDTSGNKLKVNEDYNFDSQEMTFYLQTGGRFDARHIKTLRLMLKNDPLKLQVIDGLEYTLPSLDMLLTDSLKQYQIQ